MEIEKFKINNQITAKELRVINEQGENLGIMPREAALKLAQEKGQDLVEVAPAATPPVAKIISFDKFRYQKEKEAKKKEKASKMPELKQIQISLAAARNDLAIKARNIEKFLLKGHPVEILLKLKGREKFNKTFALQKLEEFLTFIAVDYRVIKEPTFSGQGFRMQLKIV